MKNIYLTILLLPFCIFSQNFQWVDFPVINYTTSPTIGYSVACDNSGNIYESGYKDTQIVSGEVFGNLFYRKLDTSGNVLFENAIVGQGRIFSLVSDANNNIFVSFSFKNTLTIGGNVISGSTSEQPLLVKFDSLGNLLWYKIITYTNSNKHFSALTTDLSNNVYIGYSNFFNSSITKLNSSGDVQFTILQQNVQVISSLSIDNLGNIYASGSCGKTNSMFAGVSQPTSLSYSGYVVKYSETGNHQWTKYIQDSSCYDPIVSAKTPNEIYLSSSLSGAYAFGTLTSQGPPSGLSDDIYVTKLDANGNFVWLREVPGSGKAYIGVKNFLTSDANGNVYFAGSTKGITNWTTGISTSISGFNTDVLVLEYNSNGDLLMAKTAGSSLTDRADGIVVDNVGNIFISGLANGNATFDAITHSGSSYFPFVTKIGSLLDVNTNELNKKINVYPNPVEDEIFISNLKDKTNGFISNSIGQKVKNIQIENNTSLPIWDLSAGIYFLKLDGYLMEKIVKK